MQHRVKRLTIRYQMLAFAAKDNVQTYGRFIIFKQSRMLHLLELQLRRLILQVRPMQTFKKATSIFALTLLVTACGGGGGGSSSPGSSGSSSPASSPSGAPTTGSGGASSPATPSTPTSGNTSAATGSYRVQLMWTAPSTRADGSPLPLSELSGYRIYYLLEGTDPSNDSKVSVSGGSSTSLNLTLTAAGAYTFAITAVDQNGLESSLSNAVSVPVN